MVGYENKFVSYMCTDGNKVDPYHNRVNLHLFQSIPILSPMKSLSLWLADFSPMQ